MWLAVEDYREASRTTPEPGLLIRVLSQLLDKFEKLDKIIPFMRNARAYHGKS